MKVNGLMICFTLVLSFFIQENAIAKSLTSGGTCTNSCSRFDPELPIVNYSTVEERECDGSLVNKPVGGSWSGDEMEGQHVFGAGETKQEAIDNAVSDAVRDAAWAQIKCLTCPGAEFPCRKTHDPDSVNVGGSELADEDSQCTWDEEHYRYICLGPVNFSGGASASVGCKACD